MLRLPERSRRDIDGGAGVSVTERNEHISREMEIDKKT